MVNRIKKFSVLCYLSYFIFVMRFGWRSFRILLLYKQDPCKNSVRVLKKKRKKSILQGFTIYCYISADKRYI